MPEQRTPPGFYQKIFGGRSLLSVLIGTRILADKNVTSSVIAIVLVLALCYVVVFAGKYEYANALANIVFVVIGYYFGSKQERAVDEEDD